MHLWLIGGGGQSVMKLIWCSGLPWICGQLEEGWGQSVMKIMQCNSLPGIHVHLTGGSIGVVVCHVSVVIWRRGSGVSLSWKLGSVMVWCPCLIEGGISDLTVHFIWQVDLLGHFIWKLDLIPQLFWMGSHCSHGSAMSSSPVTDSFKWGAYLSTSSDKLT